MKIGTGRKMEKLFSSIACALSLAACGGGDSKPEPPKTYIVEYTVSGVGIGNTANVTLSNSSGGTEQRTVTLPASIQYLFVSEGTFLYISAQNPTRLGVLSVSIKVEGKDTLASASSNAPFGIATASGTCCK